jgi:hypothetical protein
MVGALPIVASATVPILTAAATIAATITTVTTACRFTTDR